MQKPTTAKGRPTGSGSPRKPPDRSPRVLGLSVGLAVLLGILVLGGVGAVVGITVSRAATAAQLTDGLKRADYYAGKGEFEEALKILNTLSIDNPKVKAALDDVLAKLNALLFED